MFHPRARRIVSVNLLVVDRQFRRGVVQQRTCLLACGHKGYVAAWRPFEHANCREWKCNFVDHEETVNAQG